MCWPINKAAVPSQCKQLVLRPYLAAPASHDGRPYCETGSSKISRKQQSAYAATAESGKKKRLLSLCQSQQGFPERRASGRRYLQESWLNRQRTIQHQPANLSTRQDCTVPPRLLLPLPKKAPPHKPSQAPATASLAELLRRTNRQSGSPLTAVKHRSPFGSLQRLIFSVQLA